ncbi:MAG: glycosyltransferase [bacterium]
MKQFEKKKIFYIVDLYNLISLEKLENERYLPLPLRNISYKSESILLKLQLLTANHILASSLRQRDFYLGELEAIGRINPKSYQSDPAFKSLISVVPFGLSANPPLKIKDNQVIKKLIPNYSEKDKIIIWGGGIWNWFDPLSLIKAINILKYSCPEIKLLFLGTTYLPKGRFQEGKMIQEAIRLSNDLDLTNRQIFFNHDWIPFTERADFFLASWIGASIHFDNLETYFSLRTRILDYWWTNLPILTTKGDYLSELVQRNDLGIVVDYQDINGIVEAIIKFAEDTTFYEQCKKNIAAIKEKIFWGNTLKPLIEMVSSYQKNNRPRAFNILTYYRLIIQYYLIQIKIFLKD